MCRRPTPEPRAALFIWLRAVACLAVLVALNACGSHSTRQARSHSHYSPSRYYPPPGPASDPWGPYIHEASGRFGVPELWVRRVMRQESGGQEDVISWAGAMGLMQVMPETYDGLRSRYNLGDDPFDPHNNILAGTAYLREMYDRFGAPGFLAAYNAGPNRLDRYLSNGSPLPEETINYVASIAPQLGPGTPMSGPLAVYGGPTTTRFATRSSPAGCDPDAAYNPDGPCMPLRPAAAPAVVVASVTPAPAYGGYRSCDADAAYDPTRPCQPAPVSSTVAQAPPEAPAGPCDADAAYDPSRPCRMVPADPPAAAPTAAPAAAPLVAQVLPPINQVPARRAPTDQAPTNQVPVSLPPTRSRMASYVGLRPLQERVAQRIAFIPGPPAGRWSIQVGAFATLSTAEAAAETARAAEPGLLRTAKVELPATSPFGNHVAFRARLSGLTQNSATDACTRLKGRGTPCMTVPPSQDAS